MRYRIKLEFLARRLTSQHGLAIDIKDGLDLTIPPPFEILIAEEEAGYHRGRNDDNYLTDIQAAEARSQPNRASSPPRW